MFNKATALALLALASSVAANVAPTQPTAATTWTGGQPATITWIDNGSAPSLKDFGSARVSVYVGNRLQQTELQVITEDIDVSTNSSLEFTPDPSIGPDSKEYFIRFQSNALHDSADPQFFALAFSAKFSLTGMSGEFNATVQAQIDGQTTAPLGGDSSSTDSGSATTQGTDATSESSTGTGTGTDSASGPSNTAEGSESDDGAAFSVKAGWFGVVISAVAALAMF